MTLLEHKTIINEDENKAVELPVQYVEQENDNTRDEEQENNEPNLLQEITVKLMNSNSRKEYLEKLSEIKQENVLVQYKLGSLLYQFNTAFEDYEDEKLKALIKESGVKLNRTQAFKYRKAYELCLNKSDVIQSTERLEKLGIEKTYLITTVKNENYFDSLIKCTINKNLTVKELRYEIELLNQNLKEDVNAAYWEVFAAKKQKRLNRELINLGIVKQKQKTKYYSEVEYKALEDKYKTLEEQYKELKTKLKLFENDEADSVS